MIKPDIQGPKEREMAKARTKKGPGAALPAKTVDPKSGATKGRIKHRENKPLKSSSPVDIKPSSKRTPILPQGLVVALKNLIWRFLGVVILSLSIALFLILFSFDPGDPNLNRISNDKVQNWLGEPGAIIADLLMQTLGLAAYALILPIAVWSLKIIRLKWLSRFWLHLIIVPPALVLLAAALSVFVPPSDYSLQSGYGGSLGQSLYAKLTSLLEPTGVAEGLTSFIAAVSGLAFLALSLALTRLEWYVVFKACRFSLVKVLFGILSGIRAVVFAFLTFLWGLIQRVRSRETEPSPEKEQGNEPNRRDPVFTRTSLSGGSQKAGDSQNEGDEATGPDSRSGRVKAPLVSRKGKRERKDREPELDLPDATGFRLPALTLLSPAPDPSTLDRMTEEALEQNARMLESVLDDFGVQGQIQDVRPGPVVTLYELEPARGTKSSRVIGLADDIARSMSAISARVAVVSGRNAIGVELPNQARQTVFLRELLASLAFERTKARLPVVLGKDIGGDPVVADLASMPHLLVAGTTGSGKSVGINTMILSLIYRHGPKNLRLIMVDPKMLELSVYDDIPHLLTPVVTEPKKAVVALKWAVREMEERYRNMSKLGVRNLAAFNQRIEEARENGEELSRQIQAGFDKETGEPVFEEQIFDFAALPYIVIIIDEMADLMLVAGKDVEATVQRLAQMARAAGIHLIMATQRPSVDVITGTIKANFPTRISFQVTSKIDSRTILGEQGAEQLLGMGDMLYMAGGGRITRVHGAFVDDTEVEDVVAHLKRQGSPDYLQDVTEEPEDGFDSDFIPGPSNDDKNASLYDQAVNIVLRDRRASTSYVQRRLKIGYNKAASLIEDMEREGVISAPNSKGQREILVPSREEEDTPF